MIPKQTENVIEEIRGLIEVSEGNEFQEEIMDMGSRLEEYPNEELIEENKLKGCISNVYIYAKKANGKVKYYGHSNSETVKGFIYILTKMLSDLSKDEIINLPDDILNVLELKDISESRKEGLKKAFLRMKELASKL